MFFVQREQEALAFQGDSIGHQTAQRTQVFPSNIKDLCAQSATDEDCVGGI